MQTKSKPKNVVIWSKIENCKWCEMAKEYMTSKGIPYTEKLLTPVRRAEFDTDTNNARSVPQILFDGVLIGGFNELKKAMADDYNTTTKVG